MAKIPLFFRSTFPVETYGALYDPAASAIAARAKRQSAVSQLSNVKELMDAYFSANRLPGIGGGGGRGGADHRGERPGILDRADAADIQAGIEDRQRAQLDAAAEARAEADKAAQDEKDAAEARRRPQSRAKIYRAEDSTLSKLARIAKLGGAE